MPVPSAFTDLSETASSNSPGGSEPVGTQANDYFQAAFSFIRQLYDGVLKPIAALNMSVQKLTNLANGDTSSTSTDALTGAQVRQMSYKSGEVRLWLGPNSTVAIQAIWGPGWFLANGLNGTVNMVDRFPVGAGNLYPIGGTGGVTTNSLNTGQLPAHSHGYVDAGHVHGIIDNGHTHPLVDPGHNHGVPGAFVIAGSAFDQEGTNTRQLTTTNNPATTTNGTGIGISTAGAGIGMNGATTNITIQNTGSGNAIENRPPFYALSFIQYTGAGA